MKSMKCNRTKFNLKNKGMKKGSDNISKYTLAKRGMKNSK